MKRSNTTRKSLTSAAALLGRRGGQVRSAGKRATAYQREAVKRAARATKEELR